MSDERRATDRRAIFSVQIESARHPSRGKAQQLTQNGEKSANGRRKQTRQTGRQ